MTPEVKDRAFYSGDRKVFKAARSHERRRVFCVRLVYVVFFLMLVEGPLRKWFAPGLALPIYFMRDPFVLILYGYALRYGFLGRSGLEQLWFGFAFLATIVGGIGYLLDGIVFQAWLIGARNYWLYLPMAFVVMNTFKKPDVLRFLRISLILAIPYAMLVILQYRSPAEAWINKGIEEDSIAVGVAFGVIRPFGLFTYTGQNVTFTAFLFASLLAVMFAKSANINRLLLFASLPAVGALSVLTGSRGIYFMLAAIILAAVSGLIASGRIQRSFSRLLGIGAAVGVALALLSTQFTDMSDAMEDRFQRAAQNEGGLFDRAIGGVFGFAKPIGESPVFGYGIGRGAPVTTRFTGERALIYGEGDLERNVNELGPFVGIALVALRFHLAVLLALKALAAARRNEMLALPLAGFAMISIVTGQITNSPLNGYLPWLVVGLVFAISNSSTRASARKLRARYGRSTYTPGGAV